MADPEYPKRPDVDRNYRGSFAAEDLLKYRVVIGESDLFVLSKQDLKTELTRLLKFYRRQLKEYIYNHPDFRKTLTPWPDDPEAPEMIRLMIRASNLTGVGPMAAVAGAIVAMLGNEFDPETVPELIIENGGDIYLRSLQERVVGVLAGLNISPKIGLLIPPQPKGIGICTSSGKLGPSLSFGTADAVTVIASDLSLADAAATAGANRIRTSADLSKTISFLQNIPGIRGALAIKDGRIAVWGEVELAPVNIYHD
ncbi:MAG: UPF0280 family protein [Firmicutes bacterium]|nr:UPF0280 family protein [Bacillota bacterium]